MNRPAWVADLLGAFPAQASVEESARTCASRDLWPRTLLPTSNRPVSEAVFRPQSVADVQSLVRWAVPRKVPIVPFGAGSGVCGGVIPVAGGIALDLRSLCALEVVDTELGTVTAQAGIIGERLEWELAQRGFTLGHFPSSIMCSTLGGWLATRSAGQFSSRFGKIEDLVVSLQFVDGRGELQTLSKGVYPSYLPLLLGSEGTLGIIVKATLAIEPKPEVEEFRGWHFSSYESGLRAMRCIMHTGLRPLVLRLYDPIDTFVHERKKNHAGASPFVTDGEPSEKTAAQWIHKLRPIAIKRQWWSGLLRKFVDPTTLLGRIARFWLRRKKRCLLIAGFAGPAPVVAAEWIEAGQQCEEMGGVLLGAAPGKKWLHGRYGINRLFPKIFEAGAFLDTMEVAATWDKLEGLYRAVREAMGQSAFVMAHFSHAYVEGCSIYFTFLSAARTSSQAKEKYDSLWQRGIAAVHMVGGAMSHHHGVGLLKAPFLSDEWGASLSELAVAKRALDPHHIFNPGKLGLAKSGVVNDVVDTSKSDEVRGIVAVSRPGDTIVLNHDAGTAQVAANVRCSELVQALGGTSIEIYPWNLNRRLGDIVRAPRPSEQPIIEHCIGIQLKSGAQTWLAPLAPRRSAGPDLAAAIWGKPDAAGKVRSIFLGRQIAPVTVPLYAVFDSWQAARGSCLALMIRGLPVEMALHATGPDRFALEVKLHGPLRVIDAWSAWLRAWLAERGAQPGSFLPLGETVVDEKLIPLSALPAISTRETLVVWRRWGAVRVTVPD